MATHPSQRFLFFILFRRRGPTYRPSYGGYKSREEDDCKSSAPKPGTCLETLPPHFAELNSIWPRGSNNLGNPKGYYSSQPRWQDNFSRRASDRYEIRRAFGNYVITGRAIGKWGQTFGPTSASQLAPWALDGAPEGLLDLGNFGGLTPFRRAMNAGDPFLKPHMLPSNEFSNSIGALPSNQVQGRLRRAANQAADSTAGNGLKTVVGGSAYTGNPKFVYDGTDYVRFKKLQAKNGNYNDPTFGGDAHNASQVAISRVRH